uniref:Proteasome endopeptidase complex n=1 Tax=Sus scrofa TaxID=9823 RepID=A0A8D1BSD6_PIG
SYTHYPPAASRAWPLSLACYARSSSGAGAGLRRPWGGAVAGKVGLIGGGTRGRTGLRGAGRPEEVSLRGVKKATGSSNVSHGAPDHGKGRGSGAGPWRGGTWVLVCLADCAHLRKRYQGHVGASLIVGGVDFTGPQLYSVHPHGSYSRLPFTALGSGQDAALAVLEDRFQPNMTVSDICAPLGIALVGSALGSWGNTEVPWPNPEVRKSFSEVMTEYRRRSQWSEGGEVQFQQTTVNAKAWTAWRGQNSERTI